MNELDRRIETLDESLNKTIHLLAEVASSSASGSEALAPIRETVLLMDSGLMGGEDGDGSGGAMLFSEEEEEGSLDPFRWDD